MLFCDSVSFIQFLLKFFYTYAIISINLIIIFVFFAFFVSALLPFPLFTWMTVDCEANDGAERMTVERMTVENNWLTNEWLPTINGRELFVVRRSLLSALIQLFNYLIKRFIYLWNPIDGLSNSLATFAIIAAYIGSKGLCCESETIDQHQQPPSKRKEWVN